MQIGYAVQGLSSFDEEVWKMLGRLPRIKGGVGSAYAFDYIDFAGMLVLSGCTASSWSYGATVTECGIRYETRDYKSFLRRLRENVDDFRFSNVAVSF